MEKFVALLHAPEGQQQDLRDAFIAGAVCGQAVVDEVMDASGEEGLKNLFDELDAAITELAQRRGFPIFTDHVN